MPIKAGGLTGAARCASDWVTQYKPAAWTAQTSSKGRPLVRHGGASAGGGPARRVGAPGCALPSIGGAPGARLGV